MNKDASALQNCAAIVVQKSQNKIHFKFSFVESCLNVFICFISHKIGDTFQL